jgi:hypothetical protein
MNPTHHKSLEVAEPLPSSGCSRAANLSQPRSFHKTECGGEESDHNQLPPAKEPDADSNSGYLRVRAGVSVVLCRCRRASDRAGKRTDTYRNTGTRGVTPPVATSIASRYQSVWGLFGNEFVFTNDTENAIHASPQGGSLSIPQFYGGLIAASQLHYEKSRF